MQDMAPRSLQAHLEQKFHAPAAAAIDATFRLAFETHNEPLTFHVEHGSLEFVESERCDATFYFPDEDTALALLAGESDALEAFMDGRFRADGYLLWAFALIGMFRNKGQP